VVVGAEIEAGAQDCVWGLALCGCDGACEVRLTGLACCCLYVTGATEGETVTVALEDNSGGGRVASVQF
jgi:hypothetical protein